MHARTRLSRITKARICTCARAHTPTHTHMHTPCMHAKQAPTHTYATAHQIARTRDDPAHPSPRPHLPTHPHGRRSRALPVRPCSSASLASATLVTTRRPTPTPPLGRKQTRAGSPSWRARRARRSAPMPLGLCVPGTPTAGTQGGWWGRARRGARCSGRRCARWRASLGCGLGTARRRQRRGRASSGARERGAGRFDARGGARGTAS